MAALGLFVLAVLVYLPHLRHGGFYLDDWTNAAGSLYPPGGKGVGHAFDYFSKLTLYRPVLVLYVPLTYLVLGTHMHLLLAWSVALAALLAVNLYAIMRLLGMPRVHAALLCALTVVFPWYDSARFWETADQATFSLVLASGGLWIALIGLRRSSLRMHALASLLYLLSILTYEVALPLIAVLGLLYVVRAGWRQGWPRWAMDLVAVVAGGLWVGLKTNHESRGLSADWEHLRSIITSGGTLLGRAGMPLGEPATTLVLIVVGAILLAGLAMLATRRALRQGDGWGLRQWLLLAGAGLLVAALGWLMYVPANPYYTPSVYGMTNRVNVLAGLGLVAAVYGTLGVAASLLASVAPGRAAGRRAGALALVLGVLLGVAYTHVLERHGRIWDQAYRAEAAGISLIKAHFQKLPHESTLFVTNYPANQTLGVPIFAASWDVYGMVKLQYKDSSLAAYPLLTGLQIACGAHGVSLQGAGAESAANLVPYGKALFLNMATGVTARPATRAACGPVAAGSAPGPLYLSTAY